MVERFTSGPLWLVKCLGLLIFCALFFSCIPVFLQQKQPLPPAYQLKAQNPFADTSKLTVPRNHEGERRHGNKLNYRIFGSILLWMTTRFSLHPYFSALIGGCVLLLSGLLIGTKITEDRVAGLLLGMIYAGLYAISACFSINYAPKPFDGVALGLIGLAAAMIGRPWLLFVISFLGCWTDERTVVSLLFIALLVLSLRLYKMPDKVVRCASLFAAILAYFVTRFILARVLHWDYLDSGDIGVSSMRQTLPFSGWAIWTSFEGAWILIAFALSDLWKRKVFLHFNIFLGLIILSLVSALVIYDTSRAASFSFPLILVALAILKSQGLSTYRIRELTAASALISLLAPNFEVIAGVLLRWLPSVPVLYLLR